MQQEPVIDTSTPAGVFIDFPMTYSSDKATGLSNDQQALTIEAAARLLLAKGYPVVAITYSANEGQTRALAAAYAKGDYAAGIGGLNQAEVMAAQERDLGATTASDLQMKLRIAPVTTIPDPGSDQMALVKADLDLIEGQLRQGWAILGWQNQDTVHNAKHPYAIGGGVATGLPAGVSALIQTRLIGFLKAYPAPSGTLPTPWPPVLPKASVATAPTIVEPPKLSFRRTVGIVTPGEDADPRLDADYIISAVMLGFAVERLSAGANVQFDMAPLAEGDKPAVWQAEFKDLQQAATKIGDLAARIVGTDTGHTVTGSTAVDHTRGAVVVGVYGLAGQKPPTEKDIQHPEKTLSAKGKLLYEKILSEDMNPGFQYIGRGAYTGFVDNHNVEGDTEPVGPLSTVRFAIPDFPSGGTRGAVSEGWHPRWLPPASADVWKPRLRHDTKDSFVDWGLIGGDDATKPPLSSEKNPTGATNRADQITGIMHELQGMTFLDEGDTGTLHGYTHGMIQAIYKSYDLGPSCTPYEITVGEQTVKLASCFACTVFMTATGYPPSSTHVGAAESWSPLYAPFDGPHEVHPHHVPATVLRDLNGSLAEYCDRVLRLGSSVLDASVIPARYLPAREALISALGAQYVPMDRVGVTLFLDALTVHDKELKRVRRVLGLDV